MDRKCNSNRKTYIIDEIPPTYWGHDLLSQTLLALHVLFQGLVAAIPLAFTIPALSYLKLEEGPLLSSTKIPALLLAIFGIVASVCGILTLVTKVSEVANKIKYNHLPIHKWMYSEAIGLPATQEPPRN